MANKARMVKVRPQNEEPHQVLSVQPNRNLHTKKQEQSQITRNEQQNNQKNNAFSNTLMNDINKSLNYRYEALARTEGNQILLTNEKLYGKCSIVAKVVLLSYLSLLLYDSIIQWQNFNEQEKYINGQCPWGIIFILLTIVSLILSTPSYNMVDPKYKDFYDLLWDQAITDIDLKFDRLEVFYKFNYGCQQILLGALIITIEYFQKTFWDAILYLVALDFLGQIQKNLASQMFIWCYDYKTLSTFWRTHENQWFFQSFSLHSLYYFFWDIKKLNNILYLPFEEFEENSITNDLYKKIHDLYFDLEHEYGFRFALLNDTQINKFYIRIKAFLLFFLCLIGSVLSKIYQNEFQNQENITNQDSLMGIIYILISIPIIIIQGAGYSLYNYKERSFFILVNDYKYLCHQQNIIPKEFLFPFKRIRNYYYYRNIQKIILILTLIVLQYFSQSFTEAILNLCALEFIGNLEHNLYESEQNSHLIHRFQTMNFQLENMWNSEHRTRIQFYNNEFQLGLDSKILGNKIITDEVLESHIEKKLEDLFCQIMHEDGYQLPLINMPISLQIRYLCFFIQQLLLAAMMISNIYHWFELPESTKWINETSIPWGVIYILFTMLIIGVQGVGRSEENKLIIDYNQLKMIYRSVCSDLKNPYYFEWNDQDLEAIQIFNRFQELILSVCLITIQFFSVNFYYAVLNVVALEFLLNYDEHCLGKLFRGYRNSKIQSMESQRKQL